MHLRPRDCREIGGQLLSPMESCKASAGRGVLHQRMLGLWGQMLVAERCLSKNNRYFAGGVVPLPLMPTSQEVVRMDAEVHGGVGEGFLMEHKGCVLTS